MDLAVAQWWIIRAARAVRTRPSGELVAPSLAPTPAPEPKSAPNADPAQQALVHRTTLAVYRASRFGILRPKCLVRSMALHEMLESRGIGGSDVRFGMRRTNGRFEAHAWVEWNGTILGDDPSEIVTFEAFTQIGLARHDAAGR